jgi:hypothetical protein
MMRYDKGFMLGSTLILPNDEAPLLTWANISSQISLVVSGSQYGGQTQTLSDSIPFIKNSRKISKSKFAKSGKKTVSSSMKQNSRRK